MTKPVRWGKIDAKLYRNDKFRTLPLSAAGLWLFCLTWVQDNETDGFIPLDVAQAMAGTHGRARLNRTAQPLMDAGLWEIHPDGYMIHDYADWNLTKVERVEVRAADTGRQRRHRQSTGKDAARMRQGCGKDADTLDVEVPGQSVVSRRDTDPKSKRESERRETSSLVRVGASAELALPRQDASTLIAEWIDHCPTKPPDRVIGQLAREIKALLLEMSYDVVRAGVAEWHRLSLHPSTLPSVIYQMHNPPTATNGNRHKDDRVLDHLRLAEKFAAQEEKGISTS